MRTRKPFRGLMAFLGTCMIIWPVAGQAEAESGLPVPVREFSLSDFFVPQEFGHVATVYEAPNAPALGKTLVLIQDAHVNYEAQKHIADILNNLAEQYGLRLILVEGGEGDVSLSYMRGRGATSVRKQVAEQYLRSGILSGAEYLDIISDRPLVLWGVDDWDLYGKNFKILLEVEQLRTAAERELGVLKQAVDAMQRRSFSPALASLIDQADAFDREHVTFDDYAAFLADEARKAKLSMDRFSYVRDFVDAQTIEATLDLDLVAVEQQELLAELQRRAPPEALTKLGSIASALRSQAATREAFYAELNRLMTLHGLARSRWSHLDAYLSYLELQASLDPEELWTQVEFLERELRRSLAATSDERELLELGDTVEFNLRLVRLEWTPKDYETFLAGRADLEALEWLPKIAARAERLGIAFGGPADPSALETKLAHALRFYEAARERDAALFQRTMAKLSVSGDRLAALVVGGFHASRLAEMLVGEGVHVVVVTPQVGDEDQGRYVEVMKYLQSLPTSSLKIPANGMRQTDPGATGDISEDPTR